MPSERYRLSQLTDAEALVLLSRENADLRKMVEACQEFLATEMSFECFREEMLYFDRPEQKTHSQQNAEKLRAYLAGMKKALAELEAGNG